MTPDQWRRIEDLYHRAQKCDPQAREAILEGTDPEIRERIEQMLAVDSGSGIIDPPDHAALADPTKTVIAPGTQLGPYEIKAQIGAGGMGTVYRALDTRLGRVVAIKIASARYSERFQREARAISALNHPHICTLYDIGPNYLVMEFIEGSTLAAEFRKGPLAPPLAARYGAEIAGALAEAHARGIVHRDLKPSNVMLTKHGAKVLDFGLAKMLSETGITETGGVMGTPAYMAPEQVDGLEPTESADLFALGLVLYEMSVGRLPFPGASLGQMLSSGSNPAVPAPSRQRVGVPARLDGLVAKLLEKDPAKRPQSAAEIARDLSALAERLAATPARSRWRPLLALSSAGLLVVLAAWLYLRSRAAENFPPVPGNPASYTQLTSFTDAAVNPVLSPDGRMLAFYRSSNGFLTPDQIWLKLLPDGEPIQVTHDPREKYNIAFSPDGARIAYTAFGDVDRLFDTYTVSSLGGDSALFLPNSGGLSWLDKDHLLFSQVKAGVHMGIVTARADRSDLREIYYPVKERGMAHYSYLSPDGKWVLLAEMDPAWQPCRAVPFSGGSIGRQVGPPGAACLSAAWSPDGKWIYLSARVAGRNHLWRQRFPDGKPQQITFGSTDEIGIAMAPDGRSLITSMIMVQNSVWLHDSHGDRALSTEGYADNTRPLFSRGGKRLYYLMRRDSPESPAELWRADLDSGKSEVVLPGVSMSGFDISEDEKEVVFSQQPAGKPGELWIASLDRSAPPRRIAATGESGPCFGPDGEVLFRMTEGKANYLGAMNADGTGRRRAFPGPVLAVSSISPDRCFIIVGAVIPGVANPSTPHAFALPLSGGHPQRICEGYCTPTWSADGRYLYMEIAPDSRVNPDGKTAAIPVPPGATLPPLPVEAVRNPAEWAKVRGVKIVEHANIAPGPDPSTYAYIKTSIHANLFRIPLR